MTHKYILFSAFFLFTCTFSKAQRYLIPKQVQVADYVSNQLIFKIKETQRNSFENFGNLPQLVTSILQENGGGNVQKNFPAAKVPRKKTNENGEQLADLTLIYQLKTNNSIDLRRIEEQLFKAGLIEWAQPRYINKPMFTPNDPQIGQQYHHALIKTFEAWDIEQGDTNVFIGITDAGIQFTHEDLANVKFNYADPINGIDDDNNGYVDDFRGWNSVSNSNDPTAMLSPHGMFTTGMSSATVNNALGIAGNAYNCKFIPVRIDDANGFNYGYEGITYAADRGAQIINASWGSTFYTPMGEDVIRYATINLGALVIAAAGNSNLNESYYPASYPFVLNVGATGATDVKWSGSTFGPDLDIVAPGELVRSCWPFNGYQESSGTSFSAPLVAGAAALVKSHFPGYNALQIAERLKITADTSIYQISGNAGFYHYLGAGRLNMQRALNGPLLPSVHFENVLISDNDGNNFAEAGDTITLLGDFFNYLAPSSSMNAVISCNSPFVSFSNSNFNAGIIGTLTQVPNAANPFIFKILPGAPVNLKLIFKISYSDVGYAAFEYIQLIVNKDYIDLAINNISTTITSRGNIGYNADYATEGIGISYKDAPTMIYSMSLMIGSSNTKLADNAYASVIPGYDADFVRVNSVKNVNPLNSNYVEIKSTYYTDSASINRLEITEKAWASSAPADSNFILFTYSIKNIGTSVTENLSAGLFTDWDIQNATTNKSKFDASENLSYAFNTQNDGLYAGVKLISGTLDGHYCFNNGGTSGSLNLYDGFSSSEKYNTLSGSAIRDSSTIGDISNLISGNLNTLQPGDSATIIFAVLAAENLEALFDAGQRAAAVVNFSSANVFIESVNETCIGNDGIIYLQASNSNSTQVNLVNDSNIVIANESDISNLAFENLMPGNYRLEFIFADTTNYSVPVIIESSPSVSLSISASSEFLVLTNATVDFTSTSINAENYLWDFGDGNSSEVPQPSHTYTEAGTFDVTCIAYNASCADTSSLTITVDGSVGINLSKDFYANVFPNPASDFINIEGPDKGEISIYNAIGQLVLRKEFSNNTPLAISELSKGCYVVEISYKTYKVNKRLLVK